MRLVMLYTVGDGFTFSCNVVTPIEYESPEKAKLDFGSKILEIQENFSKYTKSYELWQNRLNSLNSPEKKMECYKERPEEPSGTFMFGGKTFAYSNFIDQDYDWQTETATETFNEPNFITVDEWYK